MLANGEIPSVEGAGVAAGVARATAYRYFPALGELLTATYPHVEQTSLLGEHPPSDPLERLELVAKDHTLRILRFETEMRAALRLSLEGRALDLPMHRGLRIAWIEDALVPLKETIPRDELRRVVLGIASALGIEAFVWLTDVAHLAREEAVDVMCASAVDRLRGTLAATEASGS
jgi:AcrR family transcriptional regulator